MIGPAIRVVWYPGRIDRRVCTITRSIAVTTSQSEADEKRGRQIRKEEEERGRQVRLAEERCRKGKPLPTDNCAAVQQR